MVRTTALVSIGVLLGAMGFAAAHTVAANESIKALGMNDIHELIDGKESAVSFVEVSLEPGQSGSAHRHPGPVFGYVLEGTYELGIDEQPVKKFMAGESFYEPTNCLHRVSRNPSTDTKTRLIAVVVHPRDAKAIAIPEDAVH